MMRAIALVLALASGAAQADVLDRLGSQITPGYFGLSICLVRDEVRSLDELKEIVAVFPGETLTTALDRSCDKRSPFARDDRIPLLASLPLDRGTFYTLIADIARHYRDTDDVATFQRLINTRGEMSGYTALDYLIEAYGNPPVALSQSFQDEVDRTQRVLCLFGGQTSVYRQPDGCAMSDNL